MLDWLDGMDYIKLVEGLAVCVHGDCHIDSPNTGTHGSSAGGPALLDIPGASPEHGSNSYDGYEVAAVQVRRHSDILTIGSPFRFAS